ncbi:hypothetical protein UFOVP826_45 [uncultured Caudovirales phage]|uniref:Uncharacterized protein n=1 Tax=uncultured Caudovirales phage TaxID=2100421 RepID=A0A6J5P0A1_9CAUD|nr:hypothetical protein UFOVP826_45 [uncultured Caudovirales phage]
MTDAVINTAPFTTKLADKLGVESILLLLGCVALVYALRIVWLAYTSISAKYQEHASANALANNALAVAIDRLREKLEK